MTLTTLNSGPNPLRPEFQPGLDVRFTLVRTAWMMSLNTGQQFREQPRAFSALPCFLQVVRKVSSVFSSGWTVNLTALQLRVVRLSKWSTFSAPS